MITLHRHALVLSIYLNTRGFAFIVFEGPLTPFDWGIREMRGLGKYKLSLTCIMQLFDRYALDVLVIQDTSKHGTERAPWISNLNAAIAAFAKDRDIPILAYSRDQVQGMFEPYGCPNKQSRAELIAKHIPAFEQYVPPPPKPWISEDRRMCLFDAVALAITFFQSVDKQVG